MYIMVITANDQNFFQILPRCFCIITFHVYITKHLFLSLRILYVFSFSSNFWVIIYWSTFIILCIILLSGFEWVLFRTLINYLYFSSISNRLSPSSVFLYIMLLILFNLWYWHRCYQCYIYYCCYQLSSSFVVFFVGFKTGIVPSWWFLIQNISTSPQLKFEFVID